MCCFLLVEWASASRSLVSDYDTGTTSRFLLWSGEFIALLWGFRLPIKTPNLFIIYECTELESFHSFNPPDHFILQSPKTYTNNLQYAYARIEYANDTESTRVKFILIIWIGEGTKIMRKARVSIESGEVKRVLGHHSIQVDARDKSDLDEKEIVIRLRKAGGADYNGGRG
jgi:hypothetical protein